jgi:hypothetical protein
MILIALDVLIFAILCLGNVKRGETISAAAWSLELDGKWQGKLFRPIIDWLFTYIERDHCQVSWNIENF